MKANRSKKLSPWLLAGGINLIFFASTTAYLLRLDDGLFTDLARSAVIKAYALLAIIWTALLGYVISLSPKLAKRTGAPLVSVILLLAGLDFLVIIVATPKIWIALIWGWRDLIWLVGSTTVSGALYWIIRNRSVVPD